MPADLQRSQPPSLVKAVGVVQRPATCTGPGCPGRPVRSQRWGRVSAANRDGEAPTHEGATPWSRRDFAVFSALTAGLAATVDARRAEAVQGYTAGRIPGVSGSPDSEGFYTYRRPQGKSGGHGVGWSEIPQYSFKIPEGWEEVPVSIADLGGTEIDLRFGNDDEGELQVVVAPVLRFSDVGNNADIRIDQLGEPGKIITGFAPELFGHPIEETDVVDTSIVKKKDVPYYQWQVKPRALVSATALGNRVFIIAVTANARQWRKSQSNLKTIQESFKVDVA